MFFDRAASTQNEVVIKFKKYSGRWFKAESMINGIYIYVPILFVLFSYTQLDTTTSNLLLSPRIHSVVVHKGAPLISYKSIFYYTYYTK